MTKVRLFKYKFRIIYSLIGFFLLYLITLPVLLFHSVGADALSSIISMMIVAPANLVSEGDFLRILLIMFYWGYAGFYLGYVKDYSNVTEVKRIKRSDKNLQMTNPYVDKIIKNSDNKSKKRYYTFGDAFRIKAHLLIIVFTGAVLFSTFFPHLWRRHVSGYPERSPCSKVKTDAQNTLAALASYFSEPEHTEVPTVQDLIRTEDLTIDKNSIVIIDCTKDEILVRVIDNTKKCLRGNIYEVYMGGAAGKWYYE